MFLKKAWLGMFLVLTTLNIQAQTNIHKLAPGLKVSHRLNNNEYSKQVAIVTQHQSDAELIIEKYNITPTNISLLSFGIIECQIPFSQINTLAAERKVEFIDIQSKVESLSGIQSQVHQSHLYNNNQVNGLTGQGITIGIGDGGMLKSHLDYGCDYINNTTKNVSGFGNHANHVAGIISSKGLVDYRKKGIAPQSNIIADATSEILYNAVDLHEDYNMTITNNSYGVNIPCSIESDYNYISGFIDQMTLDMPSVLHVFAAGNSGLRKCDDRPSGFGNLLQFYGTSKNVITVGNINKDGTIAKSSSKGPTFDGRIKPEIVANGQDIMSTGPENSYFESSGTSMAAPVVSGALALMSELYKNKFNQNPQANLLKTVVCNSADDGGIQGPDMIFGFGILNIDAALKNIENQNFEIGSINKQQTKSTTIDIQDDLDELKIMLAWNDPKAEPYAPKALINDLNISVIDPHGNKLLPWLVDPTQPSQVATFGIDTINNIEQITIYNPRKGNYTIQVEAKDISTTQEYVLAFDKRIHKKQFVYPTTGEIIQNNTKIDIQWNETITTGKLAYRANNNNWNIIESINHQNHFSWNTPDEVINDVELAILDDNENVIFASEKFNLVPKITNGKAFNDCNQTTIVSFDKIEKAVAYRIGKIDCDSIREVTILQSNVFDIESFEDEEYIIVTPIFEFGNGLPKSIYIDKDCSSVNYISVNVENLGRANTSSSLVGVPVNIHLPEVSLVQGNSQIDVQLNQETFISKTILSSDLSSDKLMVGSINEILPGEYELNTILYDSKKQVQDVQKNIIVELPNEKVALPYSMNLELSKENTFSEVDATFIGLGDQNRWDFITSGGNMSRQEGSLVIETIEKSSLYSTFNMSGIKNYQLSTRGRVKGTAVQLYYRPIDTEKWILLNTFENGDFDFDFTIDKYLGSALPSQSAQFKFEVDANTQFVLQDLQLILSNTLEISIQRENDNYAGFSAIGNAEVDFYTWVGKTIDGEQEVLLQLNEKELIGFHELLPVDSKYHSFQMIAHTKDGEKIYSNLLLNAQLHKINFVHNELGSISINLNIVEDADVEIKLLSTTGQIYATVKEHFTPGVHSYQIPDNGYPMGIYYVSGVVNGQKVSKKYFHK